MSELEASRTLTFENVTGLSHYSYSYQYSYWVSTGFWPWQGHWVNATESGTKSGGQTLSVPRWKTVTVTVVAAPTYTHVGWTTPNEPTNTGSVTRYMNKSRSVKAIFKEDIQIVYHDVTFNYIDQAGVQTSEQQIEDGGNAIPPVHTRPGYRFDGWNPSSGWTDVTTDDLVFDAIYEKTHYTLGLDTGTLLNLLGGYTVKIDGTVVGDYNQGNILVPINSEVTITANPAILLLPSVFESWSSGSPAPSIANRNGNVWSFTMDQDYSNIKAICKTIFVWKFTVSYDAFAGDTGTGSVNVYYPDNTFVRTLSPGQTVEIAAIWGKDTVKVEAVSDATSEFIRWTQHGNQTSTVMGIHLITGVGSASSLNHGGGFDLSPLDVRVSPEFEKQYGSLTITKQDSNQTAIDNVSFSLTGGPGNVNLSEITDVSGNITWTGLVIGSYTLTETVPSGYYVDGSNAQPIVITADTETTLDVTNYKYGSLEIKKVDDLGAVIKNIKFKLTGPDSYNSGWIKTDSNGEILWEELKPGTYTLDEKVKSAYYLKTADPITVVIAQGEEKDMTSEPIVNWRHGKLTIYKVDSFDNRMPNVSFTLTGPNNYNKTKSTANKPTNANKHGKVFWNDLKPGTYTLTETVPDGYYTETANPIQISFTQGQKVVQTITNYEYGSLKVTKYENDGANGTLMDGVVFTLSGGPDNVDIEETTVNGEIVWTELKAGTYTLTETVPDGYFVTDGQGGAVISNTTEITIDPGEDEERSIWNEKYVSITVLKTSKLTGLPLPGTEFEISYDDGSQIDASSMNATVTLPGSVITGPNGTATFAYPAFLLRAGVAYTITEISPPPGHENDSDPITVTIGAPGGSNAGEPAGFSNSPLPGSFSLHKYDVDFTEISLPGAVFTLTGMTLIEETPTLYTWTLTTDASGNASIPIDSVPALLPGAYVLTEITPPTNGTDLYTIIQATYAITIVYDQNTHQAVANKIVPGSAVVAKFDSSNGERIGGAKFALYKDGVSPANKIDDTQSTDGNGNATWTNLRPGTYIMVEEAVNPDYIFPDDPQTQFIVVSGQRAEVVVYNDPKQTRYPNEPEGTPVPTPTPTPIPDDELTIDDEATPFGAETGEGDGIYIAMGILLLMAAALLVLRKKLVLKK